MKCSDCRRYRSKECQVNPSGKDLESAEYLTCFEPKEESGKTVVAEMGKTQATRRVRQKSTGKKILLVIAGIAVGIFVSTLGALLLKLTGLDGLLFFEALNGLATLAVTGFLIYYWVFRVEKGKLEKVPQEAKASKKRRKKTNKLLWEIPLLVVVIVAAVLVWQKPDWFRVSSHVSTSSPSVQHSDTKGSDTETIPLTQYFNGAKPIIEGHSIVVSETISAVDEAIEKLHEQQEFPQGREVLQGSRGSGEAGYGTEVTGATAHVPQQSFYRQVLDNSTVILHSHQGRILT